MLHYTNRSLENIEGEIWLPAVGYEGLYEVSNLGRMKSIRTIGRNGEAKVSFILSQHICVKSGYLRIGMNKDGEFKNLKVHVFVGKAFIPNPENKPQINHKKGIKIDNRVTELEWNTAKENMKHAAKLGLVVSPSKGKTGDSHFLSKLILDTATGIFYGCLDEAVFARGVAKSSLSYMLRGVRKNITSLIYV